jgi:hypothetical protein
VVRIKSDFWVSAHLRLCALNGIDAVLRRRGAAEAGAIFVVVDRLDGSADLYGPAPQSLLADDTGGRLFAKVLSATPADIEARMQREIKFDPDLWWLSIDDSQGRCLLDLGPPGSSA